MRAAAGPVMPLVEREAETLANLDAGRQLKLARQLSFEHGVHQRRGTPAAAVGAAAMGASFREKVRIATVGDSWAFQCPTVRFGRTELQMPILSCGGCQMQQAWGGAISTMDAIDPAQHANFVAVIRRALALGITHFETARGYGSSELQFAAALGSLIESGEIRRSEIIVQTKVAAEADPQTFKAALEASLQTLLPALGYVDLFAFHGLNRHFQLDFIVGDRQQGRGNAAAYRNCMEVVQECVAAGRVRHVGFSTHAQVDVTVAAIETGQFAFLNLHYHFIGSYTASGSGWGGEGACANANLQAVEAAARQDMGVFVISPFDKGGMLYKPSAKLAELCMPELSPIAYACLWSWHHPRTAAVHTLSVGAARPSDFDEAAAAAATFATEEGGRAALAAVSARLSLAAEAALAEEWATGDWCRHCTRLPSCFEVSDGTHVANIVWLHFLLKVYGLYDYCVARYASFIHNRESRQPGEAYDRDESARATPQASRQQQVRNATAASAAKRARQEAWRLKQGSGKTKGHGAHQSAEGKREAAKAWRARPERRYEAGLSFDPSRAAELRAELAAAGCLAAQKVVEVLSWTHAALTAPPGEIAGAEPAWLPAFDLASC